MKSKFYLLFGLLGLGSAAFAQQRFLNEVFPAVSVVPNVVYASNISVMTSPPLDTIDLRLDVYQPAGATDTMSKRPLIIFMHTGSYLPFIFNGTPTGSRTDSAAVEICKQFARRGYVVANMDYRLGWNPAGSTVDIRRASLLRAVYRSIQDARSCVRFFKADASGANAYKIDSTKIILGGQGTGGYLAMNYTYLNDESQLQLPKFVSSSTDVANDLQAGFPYISFQKYGDFDGYGGLPMLNVSHNMSAGHTRDVAFTFNLGGAVGDSSWVKAGGAPMVSFHVVNDPFAPYMTGMVYVPSNPPQPVVDVSGSGWVVPKHVALGNNDCFKNNNFTDPYTTRANAINGGAEGLFPIYLPGAQAGPWEWWDSTSVVNMAVAMGAGAAQGTAAHNNGKMTNPDMSKAKAMAYIDTIMGYVNPRIVKCLNLTPNSMREVITASQFDLFPNPALGSFIIQHQDASLRITDISLLDVTGRKVAVNKWNNGYTTRVDMVKAAPGVYLVQIETNKGNAVKRLTIQ